ncbi:MAG: exonuclease SbcCD subunit D [Planctomycetota bacterium]
MLNRPLAARLLCVGDLHLGRRPARLAPQIQQYGIDPREITPATAWARAVDFAIAERVLAVLLTGDVVDADNRYFEALTPLEIGLCRLRSAGIQVFAIAGNHDFDVLPQLAAQIPGFRVVGSGGTWEQIALAHEGRVVCHLLGYSFAARHVTVSPLATPLPPRPRDPAPVIGLLHCDVDAPRSTYAPVSSAELARAPVDRWLLGHVHKPQSSLATQAYGYLGSLVGLDPTEIGARGPWLVELAPGAPPTLRHVELAPIRFTELDLDVSTLPNPAVLRDATIDALRSHARALAAERDPELARRHPLRVVSCRLRLVGSTPHHGQLDRYVEEAQTNASHVEDGVLYCVESITDAATAALDYAELARGNDLPARVAHRLVVLARPPEDAERAELLASARAVLAPIAAHPRWRDCVDAPDRATSAPLGEPQLAALLRHAAVRAIDDLLAQRGGLRQEELPL